tara:strand:+ start:601 stop:729 length:129 start_codon:yes stop_codon:yes gene_type:complete
MVVQTGGYATHDILSPFMMTLGERSEGERPNEGGTSWRGGEG